METNEIVIEMHEKYGGECSIVEVMNECRL